MKVLVTGADGFIGKNLCLRLFEQPHITVLRYVRSDPEAVLGDLLAQADAVIHLAGENRPADPAQFDMVNVGLTQKLCQMLIAAGRAIPVVFTSSAQADQDNPYGRSKLAAEGALSSLADVNGNAVAIFRLPGVFGKWCRPDYNSVVATFCHNKARDWPVQINNPDTLLRLVYIDDVITAFIDLLDQMPAGVHRPSIVPEHRISLGELSDQIDAFKNCRSNLMSERVGVGFTRALYATYVSYLPVDKFAYGVPSHGDARGVFVEMLKTPDTGQFSFFTAHPGITRGGHYHHTKTEKFLVIKGHARFGFRNMMTNELHHLETHGDHPLIVETVPGWTHDITNIGSDEMVVMLWANEVFDRAKPDTIASQV